jgi:hypothetical protein
MNRRRFVPALLAAGALVGCEEEKKGPSQETLEALEKLKSAIDDLESRVGDFGSENWREVVPDVETSADDVRVAFNALSDALGAGFSAYLH